MFRKKIRTKDIIFTNTMEVPEQYAPQPASKFIPEWYRNMHSYLPKEKRPGTFPSIKKCVPVFDAITTGYIIVSAYDVYVKQEDGEPKFQSAEPNMIHSHPRSQAHLHPSANEFQYPKWINPWGVKTPKGYSCLFIPPMHNPNKWFTILEGVVDTDSYVAPVNFPFTLKDPTGEFLIPAGTPIAQVIPFKREEWVSSVSNDTKEYNKVSRYMNSRFFDRYKNLYWQKKNYR